MNLRDLTLAVSAALGITSGSCQIPGQTIVQTQGTQTIDNQVKDAICFFSAGDYKKTLEHLTAYRDNEYKLLMNDAKYQFNPTAGCLLALAYAANNNFPKAESELWFFVGTIEKNPEKMKNVQDELEEFCKSEAYKKIDRTTAGFSIFIPRLEAVRALMKIIKQDYNGAKDHLKRVIPSMPDARMKFQLLIGQLTGAASAEDDYNRIIGYSRLQEAFKN
ncbi:MAG TPA: hypothetical protein VI612_01400 [Candidatus Nanoarchaeia archaeon]|nr:hypothetical protein [Candidatus Nanoarchaeia archaeon]